MKKRHATKHDRPTKNVRFSAEGDLSRAETLIKQLRARIDELEAERDEFERLNSELIILHQVFTAISSTLDVDDILSMVLRAVCAALECKRAILFGFEDSGRLVRRLEAQADGKVVPATNPDDFRSKSTLEEIAQGELQIAQGTDADTDKPLEDTDGSYCIAPLISRDVVRGLLYVDGFLSTPLSDTQTRILLDFAGQAAIAIENAVLYDQTRRLLEQTQQLALTDALTDLPNRRALTELLERELHTAHRYESTFAFVIVDLDDLKRLNDTYGHAAGDRALRRMGDILRTSARKGDIIARYAGDEFVIVMTRAGRDAARRAIERIQQALRRESLLTSAGIAMFPEHGGDAQSLFFAADKALYHAKQQGKDSYRFHGTEAVKA